MRVSHEWNLPYIEILMGRWGNEFSTRLGRQGVAAEVVSVFRTVPVRYRGDIAIGVNMRYHPDNVVPGYQLEEIIKDTLYISVQEDIRMIVASNAQDMMHLRKLDDGVE